MSQCILGNWKGVSKLEGERRTALTICVDILRIAIEGAGKTKIVYWGNLNFKIVKGYLKKLIELELLEYDDSSKIFTTTKKGRGVVNYFIKLDKLLLPKTGPLETKKAENNLSAYFF